MKSNLAASFTRPARNSALRAWMLERRFSSSTVVRNSSAVAQTSGPPPKVLPCRPGVDRKSTRLNSSHGYISYAVFCLKKKNRLHARAHEAGERPDPTPDYALP